MPFIQLREFSNDDIACLPGLCNNINIWKNLRDLFPHPYTMEDAIDFVSYCQSLDPPQNFAITYKGQLAGSIGTIVQKDIYQHSGELGFWIAEPYWGKGIATEATKQIIEYAFNELKLERLFASVFDFNKASQKVLKKNGFQLECIARKGYVKNAVIGDEYRYFLLKDE
jgi:RimJ/RimL family protein N-acetyltransferase